MESHSNARPSRQHLMILTRKLDAVGWNVDYDRHPGLAEIITIARPT
jgi:hypothetical protein